MMEESMIHTIRIPQERWVSFIAALDRELGEHAVRIEVFGRSLGDQEMASLLPFHGLDLDTKGSDAPSLTITVGGAAGELIHRVPVPQTIYVGLNDVGALEWIAIEEADDVKTLMHFEHPLELEAHYAEP
jgi:hypothetical protein